MQPRVRNAGWAGRVFVLAISLLLLGCAGLEKDPGGAGLWPATGGSLAPPDESPLAGLPALPLDVPGHTIAAIQQTTILGKDAFARSAGAFELGDNLGLSAPSFEPALEWGIWRYTPDPGQSEIAQSALFTLNVTQGISAWLGIANYADNQWEFRGPYTPGGGPSKLFDELQFGDYLSPGGNLYFLAAAYSGTTLSVGGIEVTSDADTPPPPTFTISGRVADDQDEPMPGMTITLNPGGIPAETDSNGNYSFEGLEAGTYHVLAPTIQDYDVEPANGHANIVVGPDATGRNFIATPQGEPAVTYETGDGIIKALIDTHCISCHAPGGQKQDSPLTTYAQCQTVGFTNIHTRVFVFENMPPPPNDMTVDERILFDEWKSNGYAQ